MKELLRELFQYQAWADEQIIAGVKAHPGAAQDPEILKALHHMIGVQRFFLSQIEGREFDYEREKEVPSNIEAFDQLRPDAVAVDFNAMDFDAVLDRPPLDKMRPTVRTALMQVVLHSQHHRGQVASRLRALGGTPPTVDYILWKK